jgi:hypothetical protein
LKKVGPGSGKEKSDFALEVEGWIDLWLGALKYAFDTIWTALKSIASSIFFVLMKEVTKLFSSAQNDEINQENAEKYSFDGYITDQGSITDMRIGDYSVPQAGCGAIAVYNILEMYGKHMDLADVIHELEENGGLILDGKFGTNIYALRDLLHNQGIESQVIMYPDNLDSKIRMAGGAIISYQDGERYHYIAIEYKEGKFSIINESPDSIISVASIYEWLVIKMYSVLAVLLVR